MKKMIGLDRYLILDCEETFYIIYNGASIPLNPGRYIIDTKEYSSDLEIYIEEKVNMYSVPFFPAPVRVYDVQKVTDINSATLINSPMALNALKQDLIVDAVVNNPIGSDYSFFNVVQGVTTIGQVIDFLGGRDVFEPALPTTFPITQDNALNNPNLDYSTKEMYYLLVSGEILQCSSEATNDNIVRYIRNYTSSTRKYSTQIRLFLTVYVDGVKSRLYLRSYKTSDVPIRGLYTDVIDYVALTNVDSATIYKSK